MKNTIKRNQKIKLYLFLFILFIGIISFLSFPRLTLPFGLSYILYLVTRPFVFRLTTGSKIKRLSYFVAIILVVTSIVLPVLVTLNNLGSSFNSFSSEIPRLQLILNDKLTEVMGIISQKLGLKLHLDPFKIFMNMLETQALSYLNNIPFYVSLSLEWLLLVPIFLYFFYVESQKMSEKFLKLIPNPIFEKTFVLFSQFNNKFAEYMMAKFIEATILGVLVTIGLWLINFPYFFLLGFFAGVTNILPYVGPLIGIVPAILLAILSTDPGVSLIGPLIVFLVANLIDMILVFPFLVSKIVNLHPLLVVVSVMIGSQLAGVVGMIIIIPFVAFFNLLFIEIYKDLSVNT